MTPTVLMRVSSAPGCLAAAWEHAMRRLHRSCLSHSSVAISEMFGRFGAIHNQTTPVGAQAMAGGFLTLINAFVSVYGVVPGLSATLTLPDYGRVARDPPEIATAFPLLI